MRSAAVTQSEIFSYRTLEQRIPHAHPLRKLRVLIWHAWHYLAVVLHSFRAN